MKLLKFSMIGCLPCNELQQIFDRASDKIYIDVQNIDIDEDTETSLKYNIRGVPTLILVDNGGNEIKRIVGMVTEEKLLEWLK